MIMKRLTLKDRIHGILNSSNISRTAWGIFKIIRDSNDVFYPLSSVSSCLRKMRAAGEVESTQGKAGVRYYSAKKTQQGTP